MGRKRVLRHHELPRQVTRCHAVSLTDQGPVGGKTRVLRKGFQGVDCCC